MAEMMNDEKELLACFNREDFPHFHTGKLDGIIFPLPRDEAHQHNIPHIIIRIYAMTIDGFYLVQKRSTTRKTHAGLYTDSASGHVRYHDHFTYEHIEEEAWRELEEEMGTTILYGRMLDLNLEEFSNGGCELAYNFIAFVEKKCIPHPIETDPVSGFVDEATLLQLLETEDFVKIARHYWSYLVKEHVFLTLAKEMEAQAEFSKNLGQYSLHIFKSGIPEGEVAKYQAQANTNATYSKEKTTIGAIVGRFQPFHNGHLFLIQEILSRVDHLKIVVGSSQYHDTPENPFSLEERKAMISGALTEAAIPPSRVTLLHLPDFHNMEKWSSELIQVLEPFTIFFSNNDWIRQLMLRKQKQVGPKLTLKFEEFNGTQIRQKLLQNTPIQSLVPPFVDQYLLLIQATTRLKRISEQAKSS